MYYLEECFPIFHPSYDNVRGKHVAIGRESESHVAVSFHVNLEGHVCVVVVPEQFKVSVFVEHQRVGEMFRGCPNGASRSGDQRQ